jgi:hypothetical protein
MKTVICKRDDRGVLHHLFEMSVDIEIEGGWKPMTKIVSQEGVHYVIDISRSSDRTLVEVLHEDEFSTDGQFPGVLGDPEDDFPGVVERTPGSVCQYCGTSQWRRIGRVCICTFCGGSVWVSSEVFEERHDNVCTEGYDGC